MFDQIVLWLEQYPYLGVAAVFLLCGMGLPLPEEIVLLAAGYVCAKLELNLGLMMSWCGGAILVGDLVPFVLGRVFGTRLLRVRGMRILVTKRRLATFDRWFRRRGDLVILIARFVAGLRVVAFFTAGVMKMQWRRFLLLDGLGIVLIVPSLTWLGATSQEFIDEIIKDVQRVERGILWGVTGAAAAIGMWIWWWRRRKRAAARRGVGEAFVQPSRPIAHDRSDDHQVPIVENPEVTATTRARPQTPVESPAESPVESPVAPPPPATARPNDDPVPPTKP